MAHRILGWICCTAFLAACGSSEPSFKNVDVTGADFGKDFSLTDHKGRHASLADFRGNAVVMFFGYTQCPDVCPTTMMELGQVMKELGEDARRVQVLFVTLDPERDTRDLLSQYVPAFDPGRRPAAFFLPRAAPRIPGATLRKSDPLPRAPAAWSLP